MSIADLLVTEQPLWTGSMSCYPYRAQYKSRFSLTTRFGEPYELFKVAGDKMFLPRAVCPVGAQDLRVRGVPQKFDNCKFKPRDDNQLRAVMAARGNLAEDRSFIFQAPTGTGKCHGKGTEIVMFDGRLKRVEDVVVGDLLMGPDSLPREVLSTTKGFGDLFRIAPKNGEPFVCNDVHVLSLKRTADGKYKSGLGCGGGIVNIPLDQYLGKSATFKHLHKLWKAPVEFGSKQLPIPPYDLGLLLGDGSLGPKIAITTADSEIVDAINVLARYHGLRVRKEDQDGNKSSTYHITNRRGGFNALNFYLKNLGLYRVRCGEKHVPHAYKIGSRQQRLQLLAGLIDTDGHLASGVYDYVTKSERLAHDVAFVARSVGFAVNMTTKTVKGTVYHRLCLSGDLSAVPCRLTRKQAGTRLQKKDVLRTGFTVEPLGPGEYYGFTLDGDHLYLLKDFTVTHNTAMAMPLIQAVGRTTLVVVPKLDLLDRWNEDLVNILGLKSNEIGIMQADNFEFSGKKVVVGMLHSLAKLSKYPAWVKQELGFVIFDEVHRLGAEQFMQVAGAYPALLRLGLSATPERKDGKEKAFQSHIGPIRVSIDVEDRVPKVLRVHTGWRCPRTRTGDKLEHSPSRDAHVRRYLFKDKERNALIVRAIKASWKKGRKTVVFTDYIDHVHLLFDACEEAGIPGYKMGKYIGQGVSKADLDKAMVADVIFATFGKMSEGTNIPWLDTEVLAGPRSDVVQAVGRIRREYEGKMEPVVIDLVDDDSYVYKAYAGSRLKWYESLGATVIKGTF